MEIERFAQLMVNLEGLTGEQRREAKARLEVLEAHADSERLIRERLGTPVGCPHCAGTEVVRFGHANSRQRYRCKSCGRTFVALTGTPLMRLREPDKLLAYAACMSEGMTIRASAREVGLTLDRSFRWRHKFLSWIADQKPQGLTGLVEADETFFPKSYKGQRQEMPRPPRKRGGRRQVGSRSRDTGEEPVPDEPPVPVVVALQRGTRLVARQGSAKHEAGIPAVGVGRGRAAGGGGGAESRSRWRPYASASDTPSSHVVGAVGLGESEPRGDRGTAAALRLSRPDSARATGTSRGGIMRVRDTPNA